MQLTSVYIRNFRSIETAEIDLSADRARVLVGINESGKSNVLKAMSLLSKDVNINQADKRVERRDEDPISKSFVHFRFRLEADEVTALYETVSSKFILADLSSPIIKNQIKGHTLKEFCQLRSEQGIYLVDLIGNKKYTTHYSLSNDYQIIGDWKRLKPFESAQSIQKKGEIAPISIAVGTDFINSRLYELAASLFVDITAADIDLVITTELKKIMDSKFPECIYWKYEEKNMLPIQVNMDEFQSNPETCLPLKNCFELAGITDVTSTLQKSREQTRQSLINLLGKVGDKTTGYLQSVWKDYKNVVIEFQPDGNYILPVVKDKKISFDFLQRSDGFKRFVSFLLLISSKVTTNKIKNTLILIDEPEIGLHPTGARNLMSELIQIARSNYVVYSTHSIFMIDKENIGRHVIVEKKDETTTLAKAETSRLSDEEVIYKAIGFSLLEVLKPVNILFEGWRDKKLFSVSQKGYLKTHKGNEHVTELHKQISVCHAEGVKDVRNIAPLIELSGRTLIIVSDSDAIAKEQQKKHLTAKGYGTWRTYQELTGSPKYITGEDFISAQTVIRKLHPLKKRYPNLEELTVDELEVQQGRLHGIENWISRAVRADQKGHVLNEAKSLLFDDLKDSDIVEDYQAVMNFVYGVENRDQRNALAA